MGISILFTLPFSLDFLGRWCFFIIFIPSTITLFSFTKTRTIFPFLPLSLPVIIDTLSPFFIFIPYEIGRGRLRSVPLFIINNLFHENHNFIYSPRPRFRTGFIL